jgi:hypothetical protein
VSRVLKKGAVETSTGCSKGEMVVCSSSLLLEQLEGVANEYKKVHTSMWWIVI